MFDEVEKSLVVGGLLISLGVGGLFGFWCGVICAGGLLFGVAFITFLVAIMGAPSPTAQSSFSDDGGRG